MPTGVRIVYVDYDGVHVVVGQPMQFYFDHNDCKMRVNVMDNMKKTHLIKLCDITKWDDLPQ